MWRELWVCQIAIKNGFCAPLKVSVIRLNLTKEQVILCCNITGRVTVRHAVYRLCSVSDSLDK